MTKPVVAEHLGVEIVCLKRGMVDVHFGPLKEEEAVVVHELLSPVQAKEDGLVDTLIVVDELIDVRVLLLPSSKAQRLLTSLGWKLK